MGIMRIFRIREAWAQSPDPKYIKQQKTKALETFKGRHREWQWMWRPRGKTLFHPIVGLPWVLPPVDSSELSAYTAMPLAHAAPMSLGLCCLSSLGARVPITHEKDPESGKWIRRKKQQTPSQSPLSPVEARQSHLNICPPETRMQGILF